jgi:hypothetical protein
MTWFHSPLWLNNTPLCIHTTLKKSSLPLMGTYLPLLPEYWDYRYAWPWLSQCSFFFFFGTGGLNSGPSPWATPPALFLWRVSQGGVLWTICMGWFRTVSLLIPASWIARITGMNHWHPACKSSIENFCVYVLSFSLSLSLSLLPYLVLVSR